ncbi:MAG: DUF6567 family protein [Reichenbachiella sp.]|uniref:DUF6567 family protein n=1 Tax=Reichenbachiella sp. TaxID=2184521 RepID=UPI0032665678
MKKICYGLAIVSLSICLNSCGVSGAYIYNHNQNSTQVHLAKNNYQIVSEVSGSADVDYVLIFGGMNRKQLYSEAYASMIREADLKSGSRAIVNIVTEEHLGGVPPFYYNRTITVSAHIIEFTE